MVDFIDEQKIDKKTLTFFKNIFVITILLTLLSTYIYTNSQLSYFKIITIISIFLLILLSSLLYFYSYSKLTLKVTKNGIKYDLNSYKKLCKFIPYNQIQSFSINNNLAKKFSPCFKEKIGSDIIVFPNNDVIIIELKNNKQIILSTKNSDFFIETIENYICKAK